LAVAFGGEVASMVDVTEVRLMEMTDVEIADYVDTGEPMGKAGAYALQGRGGVFVERIVGSPFTVIGLPIHLLARLARRVGADLDVFDRRSNL
jgi:septum formation protein